jgi:hypothetical protein
MRSAFLLAVICVGMSTLTARAQQPDLDETPLPAPNDSPAVPTYFPSDVDLSKLGQQPPLYTPSYPSLPDYNTSYYDTQTSPSTSWPSNTSSDSDSGFKLVGSVIMFLGALVRVISRIAGAGKRK